jgi:1-aminocyclopropane-1-carboxylate deaminase
MYGLIRKALILGIRKLRNRRLRMLRKGVGNHSMCRSLRPGVLIAVYTLLCALTGFFFPSIPIILSISRSQGHWLTRSYIPAGASDHPLGGLGFTNLILEIAAQESSMGVFFDTLIICSVTGSSHAGCIVGAVAEGRKRKIIGIDASAKPAATRAQVLRIARSTAKMLDEDLEIRRDDVILDERFHAGVYGIPDEGTIEAMKCESS